MNLLTFLMLTKTARTNSQPRLEATRGSHPCSKNKCLTIGLLLGLAVAAVVFAGFQFFGDFAHVAASNMGFFFGDFLNGLIEAAEVLS